MQSASKYRMTPENIKGLENLKANLNEAVAHKHFSVSLTTTAENWEGFKGNSAVNNNTAALRRDLADQSNDLVSREFHKPIDPKNSNSPTFEYYLGIVHSNISKEIGSQAGVLLSTENYLKIKQEIVGELEQEPGFSDKSFNEQMVEFENKLSGKLSLQWRKRLKAIVNSNLEKWENEAYLYNNDSIAYRKLESTALNSNLVFLYNVSTFLHDLFWLAIAALVVLFVFLLRGAEIVRAGSTRAIQNKIKNA